MVFGALVHSDRPQFNHLLALFSHLHHFSIYHGFLQIIDIWICGHIISKGELEYVETAGALEGKKRQSRPRDTAKHSIMARRNICIRNYWLNEIWRSGFGQTCWETQNEQGLSSKFFQYTNEENIPCLTGLLLDHYNPKTKCTSIKWKHPSSFSAKTF